MAQGKQRERPSRFAAVGALVPLAGVCASVAIGSQRGPVRTCALLGTASLLLWAVGLLIVALAPDWPRRLHDLYLESRYGTPVPLATGQRIVDGKSLWSWICPHCRHRNEGTDDCGGCRAVFDGGHRRVKRAL